MTKTSQLNFAQPRAFRLTYPGKVQLKTNHFINADGSVSLITAASQQRESDKEWRN